MNHYAVKLVSLALQIANSRATEPSSLAGIAVLTQVAKTYFPEIGIILDTVGGASAAGAIFKAEKGVSIENSDPGNSLPRVE